MLTPRRRARRGWVMGGPFSSVLGISAARPVDRVDRRRGTESGDDVGEVLHVLHFDVDDDLEEILGAVGDLEIGDIAGVLADDGGEAAEVPGLVAGVDVDAADMGLLGIAAPGPG